MLKNLSVHMLNGLFLWCFQVTSPWKQISGQVELMKEPETQKGLQRGYSLFWEPISGLKKKNPNHSCKSPWSVPWPDVFTSDRSFLYTDWFAYTGTICRSFQSWVWFYFIFSIMQHNFCLQSERHILASLIIKTGRLIELRGKSF